MKPDTETLLLEQLLVVFIHLKNETWDFVIPKRMKRFLLW